MPRKIRERSSSGIYHVMLRGIDRNDIFVDEQDCLKFEKILKGCVAPTDTSGKPLPAVCSIYAYCLMSNHVHLLIGESSNTIGEVMKRIGISYVSYFNMRHNRLGPLFQGRFRSEPVNDSSYYFTLLRYIHENPVAAGICKKPGDYRWSSWHEYDRPKPLPGGICSTSTPFSTLKWKELRQQVLESATLASPPAVERYRMTDEQAKQLLSIASANASIETIKSLPRGLRNTIIAKALSLGVSMRQLARLTVIDYKTIQRIKISYNIRKY